MKCALVLFGLFSSSGVSAEQANPLGKVLQLMGSLSAKMVAEGEAEGKAFKEFYQWCDKVSTNSRHEIKTSTAKKNKLGAKIGEFNSDISVGTSKVEKLSSSISTAESNLKEAKAIRKQESYDFKKSEKELVTTMDTLERASNQIERAMNKGNAALLQLDASGLMNVMQSLSVVVDAASFSNDDRSKLMAFVQSQEDSEDAELGAPSSSKYDSHSGDIMELLEDLREKADGQLAKARRSEADAQHNFQMLAQSLTDKIKADSKDMSDEKAAVAEAKEGKAVSEGALTKLTKDLKSTKKQLDMTRKDCMLTAADHQTTVAARMEELKVIAQATKILKESTGAAVKKSYSLLQTSSSSRSRAELTNKEVVTIVKTLAHEYHSTALTQLASRISAVARYGSSAGGNPFGKVQELIKGMLTKLQTEAESESSEKKYCDEEMSKTKDKKSELGDDIEKATSRIDKAAARSAELKEDVSELQNGLANLVKSQGEMDAIRREEHADYKKSKAELSQGLDGVRKAVGVLRDYYGAEDESASLLQDDDDKFGSFMQQPAAPQKHKKSSGAAGSIIGILEVCESDFATNLAKEETQESDAVTSYEKVSQENKVRKVAKEEEVKGKTRIAAGLDKRISELSNDRSSVNEELSAVLKYYGKLSARCVAKADPYKVRKARRDAEIKGLKEALSTMRDQTAFIQRKHRHGARFLGTQ